MVMVDVDVQSCRFAKRLELGSIQLYPMSFHSTLVWQLLIIEHKKMAGT